MKHRSILKWGGWDAESTEGQLRSTSFPEYDEAKGGRVETGLTSSMGEKHSQAYVRAVKQALQWI